MKRTEDQIEDLFQQIEASMCSDDTSDCDASGWIYIATTKYYEEEDLLGT